MGVAAAHYMTQQYGPVYASRIDEIFHYSSFISIANLLWPLLLQLFVTERENRVRIGILTALVAIMALTPFRAVYLAILIFGFAIPILGEFRRDLRLRGLGGAIPRSAAPAALAAVILICAVWSGYVDSAGRDLSGLQRETTVAAVRDARLGLAEFPSADLQAEAGARAPQRQLLQRLVHPIIQAAILEHLAAHMPVPSLGDEIRRKLRLSSRPTLNEFLYEREYHSGQGVGQATSLYYGEAVAYMPQLILLWMVAAPLFFVIVWLALRPKIADVGTLCAIQVWRSSLAGIVTILPAFAIQVLTLLAMVSLSRLLARSRSLKWLSGASTLVALVAVAILIGLQCWATFGGLSRSSILVLGLAPPQGCVFANLADMPRSVDAVLASHDLNITSAVWNEDRTPDPSQRSRPILLEIPLGQLAERFTGEILDRLGGNIHCADKTTPAAPRMVTAHFLERKGTLPLDLLVVGFGLLTLVSLFREMASSRLQSDATPRVLNRFDGKTAG
jgi:hypothetical protein